MSTDVMDEDDDNDYETPDELDYHDGDFDDCDTCGGPVNDDGDCLDPDCPGSSQEEETQ